MLEIHKKLLQGAVALGLMGAAPGDAVAEESVAAQMPAGTWKCGQGSHKNRDCQVIHRGNTVVLEIPDNQGHRMPLKGELLPSDDKGKVVFEGRLNGVYGDFNDDCTADRTTDTAECKAIHELAREQSFRVLLEQKKDGSWRGQLTFFIVRGRWNGMVAEGWYRVGAWDDLRLVPPK